MQIYNLHRNLKPAHFLQTFDGVCKNLQSQTRGPKRDRNKFLAAKCQPKGASKPVKTAPDLEISTVAPA